MRFFVWEASQVELRELADVLNVRQGEGWYPYKMTASTDVSGQSRYVSGYHVIWRRHVDTSEELLQQARGIAARIWTEPEHAGKTMDTALTESMARLMVPFL